MRIDSSGNVGIGTTAPAYKLDVSGDVRWTGTLQGGSVPWARLTSFPAACPAGQYVTAVGGTLTCATPSASPSGPAGGDLGGTYPNPTLNVKSGITADSVDPPSQTYPVGITVLKTYDAGAGAQILPLRYNIPGTIGQSTPKVRVIFHDGTTRLIGAGTGLVVFSDGTANDITGDISGNRADYNGKTIQKVELVVDTSQQTTADFSAFTIVSITFPRGRTAPPT